MDYHEKIAEIAQYIYAVHTLNSAYMDMLERVQSTANFEKFKDYMEKTLSDIPLEDFPFSPNSTFTLLFIKREEMRIYRQLMPSRNIYIAVYTVKSFVLKPGKEYEWGVYPWPTAVRLRSKYERDPYYNIPDTNVEILSLILVPTTVVDIINYINLALNYNVLRNTFDSRYIQYLDQDAKLLFGDAGWLTGIK